MSSPERSEPCRIEPIGHYCGLNHHHSSNSQNCGVSPHSNRHGYAFKGKFPQTTAASLSTLLDSGLWVLCNNAKNSYVDVAAGVLKTPIPEPQPQPKCLHSYFQCLSVSLSLSTQALRVAVVGCYLLYGHTLTGHNGILPYPPTLLSCFPDII